MSPVVAQRSSSHDRRFFAALGVVILLVVVAGFAPTFFARGLFGEPPPLSPLVVAHGVLGSLWLVVFVAQSLLASRRGDWHARLGAFGGLVAVAFVATGAFVVRALEAGHSFDTGAVRAAHVFTNAAPLTAFAVLVACGLSQRRVPARHKRLMLLAAVVLLPPGIGRLLAQFDWQSLGLPVYAAFAFAAVAYDLVRARRPEPVAIVGAVALVAVDVATIAWLAAVGS